MENKLTEIKESKGKDMKKIKKIRLKKWVKILLDVIIIGLVILAII